MKLRIRKDVKPFGGRLVQFLTVNTLPNGRIEIEVNVGDKKLTIAHRGADVRRYSPYELELPGAFEDIDNDALRAALLVMTLRMYEVAKSKAPLDWEALQLDQDKLLRIMYGQQNAEIQTR